MKIGGLEKLTLIDYPGKIACVVFLTGCNSRCPFCYNPQLVIEERIKKQPIIQEKKFFSFLKERRGLLEGVVISGGEPTIHSQLPLFLRKIKKLGFSIKLDTNGSQPDVVNHLIQEQLVDYVALDIKAPKEKYLLMTGEKLDGTLIQKTLEILKESKIDFECRTTVLPLFSEQDLIDIARWISPYCSKYFLQQFRPENTLDPSFEKLKPHSWEFLQNLRIKIAPFFDFFQLR